jgi:NADP-reducing hydrogenase subunit HndB
MGKITIEDLNKISQQVKDTISLRQGIGRCRVVVHMGTCGIAAGARTIMTALIKELESRDVQDIILTTSSCAGLCSREPMVTVEVKDQPPVKYVDLTPDKAKEILEKHVVGGEIVSEYALSVGNEKPL